MRRAWIHLVAALVILACTASPAFARRWLRVETAHFIIYSEVSEGSTREAARTLELFDASLRYLWRFQGAAPDNKLEVYLLRSQARLREVSPGLGQYVMGFYTANPELIAAFATYNDSRGLDAQEVLFHEYAHHFMFQNSPRAYPAWFVEGFAEYVQTVEFRGGRVIVGGFSEGRAADILSNRWPPIELFLDPSRGEMDSVMRMRFYAQSWVAVHYIYQDNERFARFNNYIAAIQGGADLIEAFEPAFGMTPQQFEEELRRYARGAIARGANSLPQVDETMELYALPDSADDLLLPLARTRAGFGLGDGAELALEIEAIAARHPGDGYAERARVRALLLRDAHVEARAALEPMLAASADAELNYLMGKTYLAEANATQGDEARAAAALARRYYTRAFRSNPNDVATLYEYVEAFQFGEPLPDSAVDVLVTAHLQAPQIEEIAINTAYTLMQRNRFDEAVVALRRVAYSPHPGSASHTARQLLQAAMNRQMPSLGFVQPLAPSIDAEN